MKKIFLVLLLLGAAQYVGATCSSLFVGENERRGNQIIKTKDKLSIYTANGIELTMRRVQKDFIAGKPSYYDIWQLWESFAVENGKRVTKVVRGGEWETAIRLKQDFVGGSLHGFEKKTSVEFMLDGKLLDETADVPLTPFKKVIIKQHSDLYQLNSETEKIATVIKIWEIGEQNEITIKQEIKWLTEQNVVAAYMTMIPVVRQENGILVTSKASRDDVTGIVDVSQEGHVNDLGAKNKNNTSKKLKIWGDHYGIAIQVDRGKNLPNGSLWVSNAKIYNKVYLDYCGNYVVKAGEIFSITSLISFLVYH